ncbi:hypothetical protein QBC46DRAFT_316574 [Diplogelasinospora grovesii]|uniref:DUF6546 domain-containing protein n=1 Tax=Diplogelasinospora grovesii TaxID=303347 RepID=A0AAN6N7W7_9PEZI|nr:hypothetical protein QBC46DRAFT_316574 [Diplogelasinospora grovesii]
MAYWRSLPAEIRSIILEMVAEDYNFNSAPYAGAGYASVCREWQPVFEQRNFRRLVLDQERIPGLDQFMGIRQLERRDYLEHLSLRVKLDEYDCTVCQSQEGDETMRNNSNIFSRAIWNLLIILSKWTRISRGRREKRSILELGAYSPSDSKHTFRDFHLEHGYPYQEREDLETHFEAYRLRAARLGLDSLNDPYHGWVDGRRDVVSLESKLRIMGTLTINLDLPEFSTFLQTFPKVEIITGLLIPRQFYRKIAVSSLRKLLRETFTCLRWIRYEQWHHVDPQQQLRLEKDYKRLISSDLPSTLRDLSIFEDFNKHLHPDRLARSTNRALAKALSKTSRSLEHLSAAFLVDAKDFLADFWPTKQQDPNIVPWENLQTLALTSCLLHPEVGRRKISRLLMAAGLAAAFMPKLETLEIWNGGEGHACLFRYSRNAGRPQITWSSNWGRRERLLHDDVVHCWEALLRQGRHPSSDLMTAVTRLPVSRKKVKTYAATLRYLKLRHNIVDVISDYQIHWEE